jgi:hypothetical protein
MGVYLPSFAIRYTSAITVVWEFTTTFTLLPLPKIQAALPGSTGSQHDIGLTRQRHRSGR